jgi:4-amino-4-deoxy-L-arabinose transferase-like glycosyltransferase
LLALLFAQAMTSVPRLSVTFDEDLHISTGYSVLRTGDLRLVEDHPPLIGHLMSWPLLLSPQIPEPKEIPAWADGDRRLFVRNEIWWRIPIDSWVIPPRIPICWLSVLLGAVLFRWAADWFGARAGLVALALFVFDPNILAHGTLATLDLGVACFVFIAMFGVQRLLRRPSWSNLIVGGVFLGLALGAKVSGIIVLPVSVGLMVLWGLRHRQPEWLGDLFARLSLYLGTAFLTLWAVHLFSFGPPPGLSIPLPAPTYWNSFLRVGRHVSRGNPAYLLGETYVGGRWIYFPIAFALKTPLPALILTGAAAVTALRAAWHSPQERWRSLVMVSLPASYFVMSIANKINIGYRHLLPIIPFLYLIIARLDILAHSILKDPKQPRISFPRVRDPRFARHVLRFALLALLLWQILGTLRVWPFYLTYFNEIAGGPQNGYRYLADSNVDWGQGLKALRDYLEQKSWPQVRLSTFTFFIHPELYGIQATPLPPLADAPAVLPTRYNPSPGTYIISASTLRGLQLIDREMYNWFWHREPDEKVANAMLVYHVPERDPEPSWLAQCSAPITPLSAQSVAEGFGRDDLRLLAFDCSQSWLYPDAGKSAGWYVLHRETAVREDGFIQQQLVHSQLSFEQKITGETPPVTVFERSPSSTEVTIPREQETLWTSPVEWPPEQAMTDGTPVSAPTLFEGPLAFLGYGVSLGEQGLNLLTYWQVTGKPDRPFSLMGHLVDADGAPVAVADGLGASWDQFQPGDVLVQRHILPIPQSVTDSSYWLQTGAYWLDTMERWPVVIDDHRAGDRILLTTYSP